MLYKVFGFKILTPLTFREVMNSILRNIEKFSSRKILFTILLFYYSCFIISYKVILIVKCINCTNAITRYTTSCREEPRYQLTTTIARKLCILSIFPSIFNFGFDNTYLRFSGYIYYSDLNKRGLPGKINLLKSKRLRWIFKTVRFPSIINSVSVPIKERVIISMLLNFRTQSQE